ncbi:uncharacterized protein LOC126828369 isoform X2 [Patella vulgata]|uniref:uncharacterized protein LOC126828369 isoform X2 n=1 Tax=Patella vulgata TaxID=6465 RepID=UPI00217FA0F5|nr:uncharacterized protein LOC126828369 isoform X2 [Patella vulgata]
MDSLAYLIIVGFMTIIIILGLNKIFYGKLTQSNKKTVIIMSRYPVANKTKTRLIPTLGSQGAAEIQHYMTEHMLTRMTKLCQGRTDISICVHYHGGEQCQVEYWLKRRCTSLPLSWKKQSGGTLGDRIINAAEYNFGNGDECVVLIDKIFVGVDWGTDKVFQQQRQILSNLGINLHILPQVLKDVDEAGDLLVFEKETAISSRQLVYPTCSIIIPVLNEERSIQKTLNGILHRCGDPSLIEEIILSDGGSTDSTLQIAKRIANLTTIPIHIVHSCPGRGFQLNSGAKLAKGSFLLFLHADTTLPDNFFQLAKSCLMIPGNYLAAFSFQLDLLTEEYKSKQKEFSWWFLWQLRFIAYCTNIRSAKLELPYGDQAFTMRKSTFDSVGGFDNVYLLEDVLMVKKCKKLGHVATLPKNIETSSRRWEKWGAFMVTFWNIFIMTAYHCRVSPDTLAIWYYGEKMKTFMNKKTKKNV